MTEGPTARPRAIVVHGARTHNLKNVDVTLPAGKLIVVTGVSGSGKSSLAFDTVYAEGQRRYVESLSAYARQFLERMEKPDVDRIDGICPSIAIRQKNTVRNPRSTVGTTTEIHDYLRLLFARIGRTYCRRCGQPVVQETAELVAQHLASRPGMRLLVGFESKLVDLAATGLAFSPGRDEGGNGDEGDFGTVAEATPEVDATSPVDAVTASLDALRKRGFGRVLVGDRAVSLEDVKADDLRGRETLDVVVDRLRIDADVVPRLTEAIETAYREGDGAAFAIELPESPDGVATRHVFSERFECRPCRILYELPQPRLFSFNNPFGACPVCHGFGNVMELDMELVVPNPTLTLQQGAVEPWTRPHYRAYQAALKKVARGKGVRLDVPWTDLTDGERRFVTEGDADFEGVRGFFQYLDRKKYKVHVRVFLSRYRGYLTCQACAGARLRPEARVVRVGDRTIDAVCALSVRDAQSFFATLELTPKEAAVAEKVLTEIRRRLTFLSDVGLDYLTLDRLSSTLSGGESQRIHLATALGSALVGTLYVLDEPSIGLHPRDNLRLLAILRELRDQGNTVLVVEHDEDMIRQADAVVDLGLGAGEQGGRVVFSGTYAALEADMRSLTAKYLRGELGIPVPATRRRPPPQRLKIYGARQHNLKDIDVEIPLGVLTCVTGVSGSGKSTLVHDVIYAALKRAKGEWEQPVGAHGMIEGAELLSDVVLVDQSPIGRTPRSNPVTYLKAFDPIRDLFASTKDGRNRGLTPSHFSFNVPGGRCDACEGEGQVKVEMQFLADVYVPCERCDGKRFRPQVLEVRYKSRNINEVLDLTVREALQFFAGSSKVVRRLQLLDEIGLGYLRLGHPATTLSGGEAQRIKIAAHLASRGGERILYILDEPTTGLHFDDIVKLLAAFRKLLAAGHTLLVIEHNLDVVKAADWVIDLGPEGGAAGGHLVAVGTPEDIARSPASLTGRYLGPVLEQARERAGLSSSRS
ncbi:MAG: excinuclease ABC subunit UvrA [Vicinamibacterales bacterium]